MTHHHAINALRRDPPPGAPSLVAASMLVAAVAVGIVTPDKPAFLIGILFGIALTLTLQRTQ